jgi:hypothetical protein
VVETATAEVLRKKARRGAKRYLKTWNKEVGVVTRERKNSCKL